MSLIEPKPFVAAVVQDSSVFLDRDASVRKTITLAGEAAAKGARLVLFPEAFISGLPARPELRRNGWEPQRRGAEALPPVCGERHHHSRSGGGTAGGDRRGAGHPSRGRRDRA